MRTVKLTVNGTLVVRDVADNRLLVDFLREDLKLTGTKESCGVGVCGAASLTGTRVRVARAAAGQRGAGARTALRRAIVCAGVFTAPAAAIACRVSDGRRA